MKKFCVIHQSDGIDVYGPFDNVSDANNFATRLMYGKVDGTGYLSEFTFTEVTEGIWQDEGTEHEISIRAMETPT
jgi:hypothetical protein